MRQATVSLHNNSVCFNFSFVELFDTYMYEEIHDINRRLTE